MTDKGDKSLLDHIHELVAQEKELRSANHAHGSDERAQLDKIERELDQLWDLMRQRRAREDAGEDPNDARERSSDEVESYLQ